MPLDLSIALTAGVKRGAPDTVVMADMPFMSYQADDAEALRNAARYMTEGLADIVKLELDASFAQLVRKLTRAGIPICAHVGSLPPHAAMHGGYASAGRTAAEAERIVADALACEAAGAAMLLVEAVPPQVTERIVRDTTIPGIGIGAGPACHAQILVIQDLLGMSDQAPRFAEPVAAIGEQIRAAGAEWVRRVATRDIGGRPYAMSEDELDRFEQSRPKPNSESPPARERNT
jgi:3-methyl-2-oxobutanoate hydroxymethyltransferase